MTARLCLPSIFAFLWSTASTLAQLFQPSLTHPDARPATNEPICVEIAIPPARTYVIGDPTPLVWRFTNTSTQALAFMWEGCCRNNGKIEMKRQGAWPPGAGILPPHKDINVESNVASLSLSHQFARAVRLAPGVTQEFSTLLADWARTELSGDYQLRAQYLGVAPAQRPQMPRGATLWNGRTTSAALEISLLSVADYLVERPIRENARQLRLILAGPTRLLPFQAQALKLRIINLSAKEQSLDWPTCLDLWLVATNGERAGPLSKPELGATEMLRLPAGGSAEREIPLSHELLVGESLGAYQAFVDLRETTNSPRVPSNPISISWQLDREVVSQLLRDAADKPLSGARNAPLKLLRHYLGDSAETLRSVDLTALSPAAAKLAADLRTAATLKPLAPKPGRVNLALSVSVDGKFSFNESVIVNAFAGQNQDFVTQLRTVLALRHHLGWDVSVSLKPEPGSPLRHIAAALAAAAPFQADLSAAPSAQFFNADSNAFSTVSFQRMIIPANLVLQVAKSTNTAQLAAARRLPDPQRPGVEAMFSTAEIPGASLTPLVDAASLEALLADGRLPAPRVLVLAAPSLLWRELEAPLGPLLNRGLALDLVVQ